MSPFALRCFRHAVSGPLQTLEAGSSSSPLRPCAMPSSPSKIAACKAEAAGGRSGLGPRTHDAAPLSFEAQRPRLEGQALPDPPATSALRVAVVHFRQSVAGIGPGCWSRRPAGECRQSPTAACKADAVGSGRAWPSRRGDRASKGSGLPSCVRGPCPERPHGVGLVPRCPHSPRRRRAPGRSVAKRPERCRSST